jgi:hypothetical protein
VSVHVSPPASTSGCAATLQEIASGPVHVVEFGRAGDLVSHVGRRSYLHGGPPVAPEETVGAMRGALIGALLLEGEARSAEEAERIIAAGDLGLQPCHDVGGVGALAGVVCPSSPVLVVEHVGGRRAFAALVEGLGSALSFGNFDRATLDRLAWLAGEFCAVLNEAFDMLGPLDIVELQAKGLRRGDECHNRLVASTEGLIVLLAPAFVAMGERAAPVLNALTANPHFFLTLSMAAAKAVAETIHHSGPAGIVTALSGNGIESGIKVSGAPRPWYVCRAPEPTNLMLVKGRKAEDAAPMMGDSGVTETVGLGAFSLTSSLSLARVLGVDARGAADVVARMRQITMTEHPRFQLPADDFRGAPLGISVEAVLRTGITPAFDAGYAHRIPGEGRVGANLAWLPMELFQLAAADFDFAA